jgi:hypothetical protein
LIVNGAGHRDGLCLSTIPRLRSASDEELSDYLAVRVCDPNEREQRWTYYRNTATLKDSTSGRCATVDLLLPTGNLSPVDVGSPVYLTACDSSDAQRWTWDPATGVLQNALNTALAIPTGGWVGADTLVTTVVPFTAVTLSGKATRSFQLLPPGDLDGDRDIDSDDRALLQVTQQWQSPSPLPPPLYTAVFQPSEEGEIQVYGWRYEDYRAKYDALWAQGWRLKLLDTYVLDGEMRYTAVWQPSTEGEIQLYGWTADALLAE